MRKNLLNRYILKKSQSKNSYKREIFIILIILFAGNISFYGQNSIDFSAEITDGCSPINVRFTNESDIKDDVTWNWDFGNGNSSTAENPQTTYINPGSYTVTLVATYNGESQTVTKTDFITVHHSPSAQFSVSGDQTGCAPYQIEFTNQSSDPANSELSFIWSFGDGNNSREENPQHQYKHQGNFDVSLIAENEHGCTSSFSINNAVEVSHPRASFGVNQRTSCAGELTAQFTNLSRAKEGYESEWDFGDGNSSDENSPTHKYNETGSFSVSLTVTDDIGCSDHISRNNLIEVVETEASFTLAKDIVCPDEEIQFTNKSSHASNFKWTVKRDTTINEVFSYKKTPEKSLNEPGDYEIWLLADNGTCIDSTMQTIHVEEVIAKFETEDSFICEYPSTVKYINRSKNSASWKWRLGNGTVSYEESPEITYSEQPGIDRRVNFTDTLTVTSENGCSDTYIKKNSVEIFMPRVLISPGDGGNSSALSGCVPMGLTFNDKTEYNTDKDYIVSKEWQIGDNDPVKAESISTVIREGKQIPVTLTITTNKGCVARNTEQINAGIRVNPDFERTGSYINCASELISYKITAPDRELITNEIWNFGDDSDPGLPMPAHYYEDTGEMDVGLTIYNNGCPSTITKSNAVRILGPYAKMSISNNCNSPYMYDFSADIVDATSYTWDFGDGTAKVQNIESPSHTYSETGNFIVRLVAENSTTGCEFVVAREVYVRNIKSDFEISDGNLCRNSEITFDASNSKDHSPFSYDNNTIRYLWHIEQEDLTIGTMDAQFSHSFKNRGENRISLIVQDANGCRDTSIYDLFIHEPQPQLEANHKVGCMPVTFEFNDKTESHSTITDWLWEFGDGAVSTEQNPEHDYNEFGEYNISLTVTDQEGCTNKIVKDQEIRAVFPEADFSAKEIQLCKGDTLELFDTSQNSIDQYLWQVSNGKEQTTARPKFVMNEPGYYDVTLNVIDIHGCEASKTVTEFVHIQKPPVADFDADITESNCYPLVVQFFDMSQTNYPGSWEWNFGIDDNISQVQDPFYIFNRPGNHDVTLISKTSHGCADTITKKGFIDVGGPYATVALPDTACVNDEILFKAKNQENVYDIEWDFGDGYMKKGESAKYSYSNKGDVYPVMFLRSDPQNTCNIAIIDTINILDINALYSLPQDRYSGCVPWEFKIEDNSTYTNIWNWDFGDGRTSNSKNPVIKYKKPGTYNISLIAEHHLGCKDTAEIKSVTAHPLPEISISNDTIICAGDNATLWASGGVSYSWYPNENVISPQKAKTKTAPQKNTLYHVEVKDENHCASNAETMVKVQQIPKLYLNDTTLIIGEELHLNLTNRGIAWYEWEPHHTLACTDCPRQTITAEMPREYKVSVTDTTGCFTIPYYFNLNVDKKYSVDLPQAFTPTGDGINDKVYVKGWGIKELLVFKIYNRFGQLVFDTTDIDKGWDGTFKGENQPAETYTYIVQVKSWDNSILEKRGTIKLLR
ncbi:PKD domain-containing protein [Marinilabiliaceae bacterium ANBcel2]|nr:PKD domain-containing protein [Marinilabiliaceae bacterium ANBcel2]